MKEIINCIKYCFANEKKVEDQKEKIMEAFQVVADSRLINQANYDANIKELYKGVRSKEAFVFKTKIVSPGKGITNVKLLMIETPEGTIKVKLMKQDHPEFFKTDLTENINE